jgi:hypothetical protein
LKEQRIKRDDDVKEGRGRARGPYEHGYDQDLAAGLDPTDPQSLELIKERARKIEENAMRKEQMIKMGNKNTVEDTCEVNDMLIDAIKTKLAILDRIDTQDT